MSARSIILLMLFITMLVILSTHLDEIINLVTVVGYVIAWIMTFFVGSCLAISMGEDDKIKALTDETDPEPDCE